MIKISKKIDRFLSGSIKASGWSDHLTVLGRQPKLLSKSPHLKWRLASSHLKERLIWSLLAQTPPSAAQHKQLQKPISQMGSWHLLISVYYGPQKKPKPTHTKKVHSKIHTKNQDLIYWSNMHFPPSWSGSFLHLERLPFYVLTKPTRARPRAVANSSCWFCIELEIEFELVKNLINEQAGTHYLWTRFGSFAVSSD